MSDLPHCIICDRLRAEMHEADLRAGQQLLDLAEADQAEIETLTMERDAARGQNAVLDRCLTAEKEQAAKAYGRVVAERDGAIAEAQRLLFDELMPCANRLAAARTALAEAQDSFDAATTELSEVNAKYEALYADYKKRGEDKRAYHTRAMEAETRCRELENAFTAIAGFCGYVDDDGRVVVAGGVEALELARRYEPFAVYAAAAATSKAGNE